MTVNEQFEQVIAPFFWVEQASGAAVCLKPGEYLQDVFDTRASDGFEGGGYDWSSLVRVFLQEKCPDLGEKIHLDPEAGLFCAYSGDKDVLADFILRFRMACDDRPTILDLFSRAQLES